MKSTSYASLAQVVGIEFISDQPEELFLYSRDLGSGKPGQMDYLVMPANTEEVRQVLNIANKHKIPVTTMGAGLNLSGLTIPNRGGIVLDMKRMDSIIEVNEDSPYVVVEPGVTLGNLLGYLKTNHPALRFSVPDAPPTATVTANAIFNGSGNLSRYGVHPEMINGLEVVLPNGEICRTGSCAVSDYWFSKSPLPDLTGLFINWYGTTGVVTRLSLKLYPRHRMRDMLCFGLPDNHVMPYAIKRLAETELTEDIIILIYRMPGRELLTNLLVVYITADTQSEFDLKVALFKEILHRTKSKGKDIVNFPREMFPPKFYENFLSEPKYEMGIADVKKGGGFEYMGVNFPLELIPEAYQKGCKIAENYDFDAPTFTIRNIGIGHSVIFTFMYPFNRSDETSLDNCRQALIATNRMALDLGGVPWKPSIKEQQMLLQGMEPGTKTLMAKVKKMMDPNGIMNPGHWDI
ncbi:FAD-binding oxidoreductase [Desulfobacter sp.]|uniref:FAD-binding oxidoreductase n=1 Tax=Desulfobacter sp. TaxID=2294 RepID=UPI003D111CE1